MNNKPTSNHHDDLKRERIYEAKYNALREAVRMCSALLISAAQDGEKNAERLMDLYDKHSGGDNNRQIIKRTRCKEDQLDALREAIGRLYKTTSRTRRKAGDWFNPGTSPAFIARLEELFELWQEHSGGDNNRTDCAEKESAAIRDNGALRGQSTDEAPAAESNTSGCGESLRSTTPSVTESRNKPQTCGTPNRPAAQNTGAGPGGDALPSDNGKNKKEREE